MEHHPIFLEVPMTTSTKILMRLTGTACAAALLLGSCSSEDPAEPPESPRDTASEEPTPTEIPERYPYTE